MTSNMGKELRYGPIKAIMKENTAMERKKVMGACFGLMEAHILANSKLTNYTELELIYGVMVGPMKVSGLTLNFMVLVYSNGLTEEFTKDNTKQI